MLERLLHRLRALVGLRESTPGATGQDAWTPVLEDQFAFQRCCMPRD
jgi:hypothetical protein